MISSSGQQAEAVVQEGEPGKETSVVTVLLKQIAKLVASLALVSLTTPVVSKVLSEQDLF